MQADISSPPPAHGEESVTLSQTDHSRAITKGPWICLFDITVFLLLILLALPMRWEASRGDLWLDESDYALAAVRGFQANRWDLPEASGADKIIRLRHFHPPLVSHLMGAALHSGRTERHLRAPSLAAGALTVALLYVCGLYLFAPRLDESSHASSHSASGWPTRFISLACALALLPAPAHVRASSHALPWSLITLWLVAFALTISAYARTRKTAWLVAMGVVLGLLFVTSEYVVVAALALALIAPLLFWGDWKDADRRKPVALAIGAGILMFGLVVFTLWPAGLTGGLVTMLRHYVEMADDSWPVVLGGQTFDRAPKWAYAYWYSQLFPAYAAWYVLGFVGLGILAAMRKLTVGVASVAVLTGVVLLASHRSHIIGPEYLVHALPLMTILGGSIFAALAFVHGPSASILALAGALLVAVGPVHGVLSGMDARARVSRWPAAAAYLKAHWTPHSRMLAPAYGGGGRWYLLYFAGVHAEEWRVQALPPSGASDRLLSELADGIYTYVVNGSSFADRPATDARIAKLISRWPRVWQSDEQGTGTSRLVIYRLPKGVNRSHPLQTPSAD